MWLTRFVFMVCEFICQIGQHIECVKYNRSFLCLLWFVYIDKIVNHIFTKLIGKFDFDIRNIFSYKPTVDHKNWLIIYFHINFRETNIRMWGSISKFSRNLRKYRNTISTAIPNPVKNNETQHLFESSSPWFLHIFQIIKICRTLVWCCSS